MAGVLFGETFAFEEVAEVGAAGCTGNFGAPTVRVFTAANCAGKRVIEAGPATAAVELALRSEKRRVTAAAYKSAPFVVVHIFTGEGHFGAFVYYDARFFGC